MFNIKSMMPSSWSTKVFANWMGWFEGATGVAHRGGIYRSEDPRTVQMQVSAAKAAGIDGFIVDWYGISSFGSNADHSNEATLLLMEECVRQGFQFALMLDSGITKWLPAGTDKTAAMFSAINYAIANYVPSSAYATVQGKPAMFEFGWSDPAAGLDVVGITSAFPQFTWLSQDSMKPGFVGTFGWVNGFAPDTPYAYIDRMLGEIGLLVPVVFWGFNDTSWRAGQTGSVWSPSSPARVIDHEFGKVWKYNWSALAKKYGATGPEMVQIATWNDYEERTAIEPFVLSMLGETLY